MSEDDVAEISLGTSGMNCRFLQSVCMLVLMVVMYLFFVWNIMSFVSFFSSSLLFLFIENC